MEIVVNLGAINIRAGWVKMAWLIMTLAMISCSKGKTTFSGRLRLDENWLVRQSGEVRAPGSVVSGEALDTTGWYKATVPSTIMGVLAGSGLYKDIFSADSLQHVSRKPFDQSWWYRTKFILHRLKDGQHAILNLDGISYCANIWLNGKLVAARDSVFGSLRTFSFDVTGLLRDPVNILAVEVFRYKTRDPGPAFDDWNPVPADNNMGIWRDVFLIITGDVALQHVQVRTDNLSGSLDEASLSIIAELVNHSSAPVNGRLIGKSEDFSFEIPVHLKRGERKKVTLGPEQVRSLHVSRPKLWWCSNFGDPYLYNLNIQFVIKNAISDVKDIPYGIRTVETYLNADGHMGFKLNGREVLIRGAGWTNDIFLRDSPERNEIQVQYVKHMNLNTIRFESFWGTGSNIYDLCDKYGILVMAGWSCQREWGNFQGKEWDESGGNKSDTGIDLMVRSLGDQIQYLQNHPSIIVWMVGSDRLPRPDLETKCSDLIRRTDNRPYLTSSGKRNGKISGHAGVKMNEPYNYVGPSYWYTDSLNGGAFGFNIETNPGPQLPVMESLLKMIPQDKLWPISESWNFPGHPSESFGSPDIFNNALFQQYGRSANLENYLLKSDVQSYEAMRAMFEAYRVNRPKSTGIIQWKLNSALPSCYRQLYDYYLLPTAAYYAARKANTPLQIIYDYGNHDLYLVNETQNRFDKLKARIRLSDLNGKQLLSEELLLSIEGNCNRKIFSLPVIAANTFLSLELINDRNKSISDNFYWLSGRPDEYAWDKTERFYTPLKVPADFKQLNYIEPANVEMNCTHETFGNVLFIDVKLRNSLEKPAFFIHLCLKDKDNRTIFPVFWDDNYISLLPGDSRSYRCTIDAQKLSAAEVYLTVSGWNMKEQTAKIKP
jgi:exo-1,4-beta-D-glucosaminidase